MCNGNFSRAWITCRIWSATATCSGSLSRVTRDLLSQRFSFSYSWPSAAAAATAKAETATEPLVCRYLQPWYTINHRIGMEYYGATAVGKHLLPGWLPGPKRDPVRWGLKTTSCCQSLNQNVTWRGSFAWRLLENWNRNVRISALIIRRYVLRTSQVSWLLGLSVRLSVCMTVCPLAGFFLQWIFFCVLFYSLRFGFHPYLYLYLYIFISLYL